MCIHTHLCVSEYLWQTQLCSHTQMYLTPRRDIQSVFALLSCFALLHDLLESRGAGSASHYGCATALNLLSAHSPDRQLVNRGRVRPCVHARGRELINTGAVHKIIKIKLSQQVASQCQDPSLSPARRALLWAVKQTGGSGNRGPRCSTHQPET